ncbi:hypothetical protein P5673_001113 [Acropora cervicornis]|uniref:Uncharacterized protein n=1 Tax=Acropora cervicornis TaxID=6130 RepID=A0AAD9R5J4_ACRCE|nr:hypothetical protein P5673_001113 [Acropora cervicornis]
MLKMARVGDLIRKMNLYKVEKFNEEILSLDLKTKRFDSHGNQIPWELNPMRIKSLGNQIPWE